MGRDSNSVGFFLDAARFILSYRQIIENAPLQVYGAALVFSPTGSEVKCQHWEKRLPFIGKATGVGATWNPCLQALGYYHWDVQKNIRCQSDHGSFLCRWQNICFILT